MMRLERKKKSIKKRGKPESIDHNPSHSDMITKKKKIETNHKVRYLKEWNLNWKNHRSKKKSIIKTQLPYILSGIL
jgi:hypothetical protein